MLTLRPMRTSSALKPAPRVPAHARTTTVWLSALVVAACGSNTPAPRLTAHASPRPSASAPVVTPPPTLPAIPTADQSAAVGRALFPEAFKGGFLECDAITGAGFDVTNCPMSTRLKAEVAHYAANYHTQCPRGCGGALLIIRDQCGSFPDEQVTTAPNPAIAIVKLSGDTTCRGVAKTFYVTVRVESGQAVADDIDCNVGDAKYGMYNPDPKATGPPPCPS
jgi:hypothetical protein